MRCGGPYPLRVDRVRHNVRPHVPAESRCRGRTVGRTRPSSRRRLDMGAVWLAGSRNPKPHSLPSGETIAALKKSVAIPRATAPICPKSRSDCNMLTAAFTSSSCVCGANPNPTRRPVRDHHRRRQNQGRRLCFRFSTRSPDFAPCHEPRRDHPRCVRPNKIN